MNDYRIDGKGRWAYWIDTDKLKHILLAANNFTGAGANATITFVNNHELVVSDVDTLEADPEARSVAIKSVMIHSSSRDPVSSVYIHLNRDFMLSAITYRLNGDRSKCLEFETAMKHELSAASRWYGLLYRWGFVVFILVGLGMGYLTSITRSSQSPISANEYTFFYSLTATGLLYLVGRFLFPRLEFAIGRGARVAAARRAIAAFIFGTVVLGSVIAVFQDAVVSAMPWNQKSSALESAEADQP